MDNDVINLAKAIRQTESGGNFGAKGASGESGAYQWMPDTWKAHAKQALGNEAAEMTPSNQNAVAYTILKSWKDEGLNPAQIAARWNSGSEKGWENKVGVNSAGVKYDVPRYVKSVTDAYQQVKGGANVGIDPNNPSANPQLAPQEGGGFLGFAKDVVLDPVETLLAKPAARATEALGRTGLFGQNIKRGYEELQKEGAPLNVLGMEIEQQKGGTAGAKQIAGEALKTGSYLYGGGAASGAVKSTLGGAMGQGMRQIGKLGAITGGMYGAGEELTQSDSTLGSVLGAGAIGAGVGAVTGGILGAATPLAVKVLSPAQRALKRQQAASDAVGQILQGKPADREVGIKVLSSIDTEGVTTSQELADRVDENIKNIVDPLDRALETNTLRKVLNTLTNTVDVEGKSVTSNYVADAINQLEKQYIKTNEVAKLAKIRQLRERAINEGLTVKDINDLARIHGEDLNAYNLNGELASGLARQTAENTRMGVKSTARNLFGDKIAQEADKIISQNIRVKTLLNKQITATEKVRNRTLDPSFMQSTSALAEEALNVASFGFIRGMLASALRRGASAGTRLDALALEGRLANNLKIINRAADPSASERTIISRLNEFVKNNKPKQLLALPAPKQVGSKEVPHIMPDPRQFNPDGSLREYKPELVPAAKGPLAMKPKGTPGAGQMTRTYLSTPEVPQVKKPGTAPKVTPAMKKPDAPVTIPANIPRTKEIVDIEKKISKNVAEQKAAIKAGDFALVAKLKEAYKKLVETLKFVIKKTKEGLKEERGMANFGASIPKVPKGMTSNELIVLRDYSDMMTKSYKPKDAIKLKGEMQDIADKYKFKSRFSGDKSILREVGDILDAARFDQVLPKFKR